MSNRITIITDDPKQKGFKEILLLFDRLKEFGEPSLYIYEKNLLLISSHKKVDISHVLENSNIIISILKAQNAESLSFKEKFIEKIMASQKQIKFFAHFAKSIILKIQEKYPTFNGDFTSRLGLARTKTEFTKKVFDTLKG